MIAPPGIAGHLLHCRLTSVALVMFVIALMPLPLGCLIGRFCERGQATG